MNTIKMSAIREQFPMYSDLSDDQLLIGIRQKFYPGIPMGRFSRMIEYDTQADSLRKEVAHDGGGMRNFVAGVGKAMTDIGRGAGQMVGAVSRNDVAESRARDRALMETGAGTAGNIAGNVLAFAPTAMVPGANTITGGAAMGGLIGLLQPSASSGETAANVALGGAAGGIVPAIGTAYRAVKSAAEPFYESGKNAIVGRAINRAAGKDARQVAKLLEEAGRPAVGPFQPGMEKSVVGELVPGSVPTVAQAANNAGVAALERAASATNPEVTNAIRALSESQNAARVNLLQELAGTGGKREFYTAARDATAESLYGAARRLGVDPAKLTPDALENIAQFSRRIPDSVLAKARELAKIGGEDLTDATSVKGLHWVKKGIDSLIGQAKRAGDDTSAAMLVGLQKDLLTGMDRLSPAYATARKTYEAMSKPINEMETVQELLNRSVRPLDQVVQPGAYARALSDQTAQRATGFQGATLDNTVTNQTRNALESVLEDLRRTNFAANAGRGSGSDTAQKLAYTNMLDQAGVPSFLRDLSPLQMVGNVGSRIGDAAYARANRELSERLAEIMLDPAKAAELMRTASPQQRKIITQLLQQVSSGAAMTVPAIANSRK